MCMMEIASLIIQSPSTPIPMNFSNSSHVNLGIELDTQKLVHLLYWIVSGSLV